MGKKLTKREKQKLNKFAVKHWKIVVSILLLLVLAIGFAYYMGWLDKLFPKDDENDFMSEAGNYNTKVEVLNDLKINFLDVGQGDCIVIQLPDGKNMIIDSGENKTAVKEEIADFTSLNNITCFDYMLLTHQDSDHAGSMAWVIDNYEIGYIFRPNNYSDNDVSKDLPNEFNPDNDGKDSTTKTYGNFMVSAYNEKCKVEVFNKSSDFTNTVEYNGTKYPYKFDFLTPTANREEIKYTNYNDYSPILMLEYAGKRVMFTGDAEEAVLEEYVNAYGSEYNVDVLKVGHHGSHNATSLDFVNAIDPEYAIIQCGKNNEYGHPHEETLNIYNNHEGGVAIYRTDNNGRITLSLSVDTTELITDSSFVMEKVSSQAENYIKGNVISTNLANYNSYLVNRLKMVV